MEEFQVIIMTSDGIQETIHDIDEAIEYLQQLKETGKYEDRD